MFITIRSFFELTAGSAAKVEMQRLNPHCSFVSNFGKGFGQSVESAQHFPTSMTFVPMI